MSSLDEKKLELETNNKNSSEIEQRENELIETEAHEVDGDIGDVISSEHEMDSNFKKISEELDEENFDSRVGKYSSQKYMSYGLIGLFILGMLLFISFVLLNDSKEIKVQARDAVDGVYLNQDHYYLKENITQEDLDYARQVVHELNFFNRRPYDNQLQQAQEKFNLLIELNQIYQSDVLLLNGNQYPALETLTLQADTSVEGQKDRLKKLENLKHDPMIEDIYNIHQHALVTLNQIHHTKELTATLPSKVSTRAELPEAVEKIRLVESEIDGISHHPQMEEVNQLLQASADMVGQVFIVGADLGEYDSALEEAIYDSKALSLSLRGSSFDNSPLIALTFDDGPNEEYTTQLLDVLAKHDVQATFFVMGAYVDEFPAVARRIVEEGHEIANHTYNHYDLSTLSDEEILIQFEWTQESIEDITGVVPDTYRLPFGSGGKRVIDLLPDMTSILWNLDSMDWDSNDVDEIYETIMNQLHHHTLLLMHDTHQATPDTIDLLIPELKERGYSFVTPEELDFDMRYFAE